MPAIMHRGLAMQPRSSHETLPPSTARQRRGRKQHRRHRALRMRPGGGDLDAAQVELGLRNRHHDLHRGVRTPRAIWPPEQLRLAALKLEPADECRLGLAQLEDHALDPGTGLRQLLEIRRRGLAELRGRSRGGESPCRPSPARRSRRYPPSPRIVVVPWLTCSCVGRAASWPAGRECRSSGGRTPSHLRVRGEDEEPDHGQALASK